MPLGLIFFGSGLTGLELRLQETARRLPGLWFASKFSTPKMISASQTILKPIKSDRLKGS